MNNKELGKALKQLKNMKSAGTPNEEFLKSNKEILLMQINNAGEKRKFGKAEVWTFFEAILPDSVFRYVVRPAMIGIVVFGVAFGGWAATVSASYNSLPGDTLYSLKLIAENAQVSLATKENKPTLQVEFAGRRVEEVAKIVEKDSISNKEERTKKAVEGLSKQLVAVKESLDILNEKSGANVIEVAKLVDRKTAEYNTALNKTTENSSSDIKKEVAKANELANDAGIKAVQVIVQKHEEGAGTLNQAEIINTVGEKIKLVEEQVAKMGSSTSSTTSGSPAGTTSLESQIGQEAKDTLVEAKEALGQQNLNTAVDKLVTVKNLVNSAAGLGDSDLENNTATTTAEGDLLVE